MIRIPVSDIAGPGSQPPLDGEPAVDYIDLPAGMDTYRMPVLPEEDELWAAPAAAAILAELARALECHRAGETGPAFDLLALPAADLALVDQVLGEGEVSIRIGGDRDTRIQESVLAGVWRIRSYEKGIMIEDVVEVGDIPARVRFDTFAGAAAGVDIGGEPPAGVVNAPPVLVEIGDRLPAGEGGDPHVINLTLLPQTDEDLSFLDQRLGRGEVVILSRGYGNCRLTATATRHVWWVQYYNSQDVNILNSLEVSVVPAVARAAQEDIDDSAGRLQEILAVYG